MHTDLLKINSLIKISTICLGMTLYVIPLVYYGDRKIVKNKTIIIMKGGECNMICLTGNLHKFMLRNYVKESLK